MGTNFFYNIETECTFILNFFFFSLSLSYLPSISFFPLFLSLFNFSLFCLSFFYSFLVSSFLSFFYSFLVYSFLSFILSLFLPFFLSFSFFHSVFVSTFLSFCLSVFLPSFLSLYLSIYLLCVTIFSSFSPVSLDLSSFLN